jgi:hypothetical protein
MITSFLMIVEPIGQVVNLIVGEFAILDDGFADKQKFAGVVIAHISNGQEPLGGKRKGSLWQPTLQREVPRLL